MLRSHINREPIISIRTFAGAKNRLKKQKSFDLDAIARYQNNRIYPNTSQLH